MQMGTCLVVSVKTLRFHGRKHFSPGLGTKKDPAYEVQRQKNFKKEKMRVVGRMISCTGKTGLSVGEVGCRQGKVTTASWEGEVSCRWFHNSMLEDLEHAEFACARKFTIENHTDVQLHLLQ